MQSFAAQALRFLRSLISRSLRSGASRQNPANQHHPFHPLTKAELMKVWQCPDDSVITILVFVPDDFLSRTSDDGLRVMNLYETLSRHFNIHLVAVVGYGAEFEKREINSRLTVYLVPAGREFHELLINEQKKAGGILRDILLIDHYNRIPLLVDLCRELASETDILISSQPYFFKMMNDCCRNKVMVYDAPHVASDVKRSFFENPAGNETARRYLKTVCDAEAFGCNASNFILCASVEDREKLCRIYGAEREKIVVVPRDVLAEKDEYTAAVEAALVEKLRTAGSARKKADHRCRMAIDGRILHRNITGSERYIHELIKHIKRYQNENCRLCLVNSEGYQIEDVSAIPYVSIHENIDLFHRPYQVSSYNDVLELLIARKSIFSLLDLILCKNPDYFGNPEEHRKYVELMNLALNCADRILAISEHARQDIIENFNIPDHKIDVVYLGLDLNKFYKVTDGAKLDEFRAAYRLPQKFILYVGTDYPHKNLKNLYIAFSKVMNLPSLSDYFLVTAGINYHRHGTGYLKADLKRIKDRVISLGHFADENLHLLYNAAGMYVFPSLYEGFGLTILEAMACGTPVISSDATSLPEVAGDAAYLVDAGDPDLIAKAIEEVATDGNLRNALIEKGLDRVKLFTWEKCAKETYAVYEKMLREDDRERTYDDQILKLLFGRIMEENLMHRKKRKK